MKHGFLTALVLACTWAASAPSVAGPVQGTLVTKYKTGSTAVTVTAESGAVVYNLSAQNFDDMDGVAQGYIAVDRFDWSTFSYSFVVCAGPAFANTVTVNKTTGASSVRALLDPNAPGCYGANSTALDINLVGTPNGNYRSSSSSSETVETPSGTFLVSGQGDRFDEVFSGSIGYFTGSLSGSAQNLRITQRTRTR